VLRSVVSIAHIATLHCITRCVAVCCSVLQWVAVCCSVLQCVAVCCSVVQCVAVWFSDLQCVAVCSEYCTVSRPITYSVYCIVLHI